MALIILAHPKFEQSFANKAIIRELQESNLNLEIRNIHSLYPDYKIDIKAEQEALLRHQTIVFQSPFYWLNVSAILKLYFDEVLEYQFAYGSKGDKLKGKNFLLSLTTGAREEEYKITGKHHLRMYEFCKNIEQTAYYAQMNYIEPISLHGMSLHGGPGQPPISEHDLQEKAQEHAKNMIKKISELNNQL